MAQFIGFTTELCTRCHGTGEHSYCQMYGKKCFKCAGSGKQPTKAALKARKWIEEQRKVRADSVKVGQRISTGCSKFNVVSIGEGSAKYLCQKTGQWISHYDLNGATTGYSCFPETIVELIPDQATRVAQLRQAGEMFKGSVEIKEKD